MTPEDYILYASRLGELSPAQLKDLGFRLSKLNPKDAMNLSEDWLLAGIIEAMTSQGLIKPELGLAFKRHPGYLAYCRVRDPLMDWLAELIAAEHRLASWRLKLAREAGLALMDYARKQYHPLIPNAGMILKLSQEIPLALEQAFPGYIEAGLGHLIIEGGLGKS
jgi:hypothetical protein